MLRKSVLLSILIVLLGIGMAYADTDRLGTAGALELRLPIGARSTALGGAVLSNVSGAEALFWNPAGAAKTEGYEAMFSTGEMIADIKLNYFGVTATSAGFGTIGVNAKVLDIGEWEQTTEDHPDGNGIMVSPSFWVLGMTYARQMTDQVAFGATFNYVSESVLNSSASGFAMDFGFQYVTPLQGLKFGIVLKSIGPDMRFSGADFERSMILTEDDPNAAPKPMRLLSAPFELPSNIMFGVNYKAFSTEMYNLNLMTDLQFNNHSEDEFRFGGEFIYNEMFALRGGMIASGQDDYLYGASFGAGLILGLGNTDLTIDYSYVPTEYFNDQNWFSVKMGF